MPNQPAVDLEIGLQRRDATGFTVELRFDRSGSGGEIEIFMSARGSRCSCPFFVQGAKRITDVCRPFLLGEADC